MQLPRPPAAGTIRDTYYVRSLSDEATYLPEPVPAQEPDAIRNAERSAVVAGRMPTREEDRLLNLPTGTPALEQTTTFTDPGTGGVPAVRVEVYDAARHALRFDLPAESLASLLTCSPLGVVRPSET